MTLFNRLIAMCLSACLLYACGGESTDVSRDGAEIENGGSIERVDPAFDALVPQGAKIEKLAGVSSLPRGLYGIGVAIGSTLAICAATRFTLGVMKRDWTHFYSRCLKEKQRMNL